MSQEVSEIFILTSEGVWHGRVCCMGRKSVESYYIIFYTRVYLVPHGGYAVIVLPLYVWHFIVAY